MPKIVDYTTVTQTLTQQGMRCLYFNSGAFGFDTGVETISRGWIGSPDPSIREAAQSIVRQIPEPIVLNLETALMSVWRQELPGVVWVMPRSHWAFEFEYGTRAWMPGALERMGVDWKPLALLNTAPAIEFELTEAEWFEPFARQLLANLNQSDFQLVFPGRRTICTVHSRTQLWWTTVDPAVAAGLDRALMGFEI